MKKADRGQCPFFIHLPPIEYAIIISNAVISCRLRKLRTEQTYLAVGSSSVIPNKHREFRMTEEGKREGKSDRVLGDTWTEQELESFAYEADSATD